jgi:hypothetical protein
MLVSENPTDWFGKSSLGRPLGMVYPSEQSSVWNTKLFGPCYDRLGSAAIGNQVARFSISCLLLHGCPTAILWTVAAAIVNALDTVFWCWRKPHISYEALKTFKPPIADGNSSAPVQVITNVFRTVTPILHHIVDVFYPVLAQSVRFTPSADLSHGLPLHMPTTGCMSAFYIARVDNLCFSAVTKAKPAVVTPFLIEITNNDQPAVSVAYEILNTVWNRFTILFCHFATPIRSLMDEGKWYLRYRLPSLFYPIHSCKARIRVGIGRHLGLIAWKKADGKRSWITERIPLGQQEDNTRETGCFS